MTDSITLDRYHALYFLKEGNGFRYIFILRDRNSDSTEVLVIIKDGSPICFYCFQQLCLTCRSIIIDNEIMRILIAGDCSRRLGIRHDRLCGSHRLCLTSDNCQDE